MSLGLFSVPLALPRHCIPVDQNSFKLLHFYSWWFMVQNLYVSCWIINTYRYHHNIAQYTCLPIAVLSFLRNVFGLRRADIVSVFGPKVDVKDAQIFATTMTKNMRCTATDKRANCCLDDWKEFERESQKSLI